MIDNSISNKRELVQHLIRDVRMDLDDYAHLKTLLVLQRELMQRRDNDALIEHNIRQTALCDKLAHRAATRSLQLSQLGFNADTYGMKKLISALPETIQPQLNLLWKNLQAKVEDSQQQNDVNGKLLAMQQASIKRVLQRDEHDQIDYGVMQGI